jgi:dolichol-phosphate mannosyltransferase|tara:strand:- start:112 stop:1062 length:951 start_codon:yes stop_codon:yes gene_type:complete
MNNEAVELSVVVPVYNESDNIPEFLARMVPVLEASVDSYEIVFSMDPGTDDSEQLVVDAAAANPAVKMLVFSRRFGQPTATLAGLEHSSGRAAVVIDVDLQDPPDLIPEMLERWRAGFDVVYAQRGNRDGETLVKKVVAKLGYGFLNRFSDVEIPRDTGDFRLIDRRVIDQLERFPEAHGFLRGLVALIGYDQTSVAYDRAARHSGRGNYNRFLGSLRIGFNGVVAFSNALLNLSTILGFLAAGASFVTGLVYLGLKLSGADFPLGNPTIVILILLLGGFQLICLGVLGQYIGRIYDEAKRRPRYIVDRAVGLDIR